MACELRLVVVGWAVAQINGIDLAVCIILVQRIATTTTTVRTNKPLLLLSVLLSIMLCLIDLLDGHL